MSYRAVPSHRRYRNQYLMLSSMLAVAMVTGCINQSSTTSSPAEARLAQPSQGVQPTPSATMVRHADSPSPSSATSEPAPATVTAAPQPSSDPVPPFVVTETADALTQPYTNTQAGYTVLLPAAWTVAVDDRGTAAFLTQAGLAARRGGWSNAEVAVGGIQFVGRTPQPTENAQYQAILPNHCLEVDHRPVAINGVVGRVYTLDCDNPTGSGTHRRQQLYLPDGPRFIEFRLNVAPTVAGTPTPLLTAIAASFRRTTS